MRPTPATQWSRKRQGDDGRGPTRYPAGTMPRILAYLLLSLALVFQGMGTACASGRMETFGSNGGAAGMAMHCAHQTACKGCANNRVVTQDCMQLCSMPASLLNIVLMVPPQLTPANLPQPLVSSLVERIQVPPTPPPIA